MGYENDCKDEAPEFKLVKFLFYDCETTGLNPKEHDIIEFAGAIYFGDKRISDFEYQCQPIKIEKKKVKLTDKEGRKIYFNHNDLVQVVLRNKEKSIIHVKAEDLVNLNSFQMTFGKGGYINEIEEVDIFTKNEYGEFEQRAMETHKISQQDISGFSRPEKVARDFYSYLIKHNELLGGAYILVGHNIEFDKGFLLNWLYKLNRFDLEGLIAKNLFIDTLDMARYAKSLGLIDCAYLSLRALSKYFNINLDGAHRAKNDIEANIEVFFKLKSLISNPSRSQDMYSEQINIFDAQ